MKYFAGFDLNLASSGIVVIDEVGNLAVADLAKTETTEPDIRSRFKRYHSICHKVYKILKTVQYYDIYGAVIENYSYGSKGAKKIQMGESGALVRDLLYKVLPKDCFLLEIAPVSLKKFILGAKRTELQGKDSKAVIIKEIYKRYGKDFNNDDIADAFVMAELGRCLYLILKEEKIDLHKYQKEVLQQIIKKNKLK